MFNTNWGGLAQLSLYSGDEMKNNSQSLRNAFKSDTACDH